MTIKNETGTKAVNIRKSNGFFIAMFVDIYNGEEQVLETKEYKRKNSAIKWANRKLEL